MAREKSARVTLRPDWWDKIEPFEYISDGSPLGDETKRIVEEIARTSRSSSKQAPIPNPNVGGFYHTADDTVVVSSNPKSWARHPATTAHILAHEHGHAELQRDPVLRHTQGIPSQLGNPNISHLPTLVSVLGGAFAPSRASRAASVVGGTIWNALPLVAERHADDYARDRVLNAAKEEFQTPYATMADVISRENQGTYHRGIARTGLLGLLAMGAREAYDHRDAIGRAFKGAAFEGETRDKAIKDIEALSPVPINNEYLHPMYGGFYRYNTPGERDAIFMNKFYENDHDRPYMLAHEIGHVQHEKTLLGRVLQRGLHSYAGSNYPGAAALISGTLMPTRAGRGAGVLGSTLFAGIHPLNEHFADRNARETLRAVGAPDDYWQSTQKYRDDNIRLALKNTKVTGLLGLLGMGAREVYDHRNQILDAI